MRYDKSPLTIDQQVDLLLSRAIKFCQRSMSEKIVSTLSTQLSWSRFTEMRPLPLLRARLHQAIAHAREMAAR